MSSQALKLESLRSLIQGVERPVVRETIPFSAVTAGIPRGALVEIVGAGKTEAVAQFLAENPSLRVAWIEDHLTVYPCALLQRQVLLNRVLFIEAEREIFWAASQVLRSGLFECVVMSFQESLNEKVMRRLQLETEKANTGFFLLPASEKEAAQGTTWAIALKLEARRRAEPATSLAPFAIDIHILKQRFHAPVSAEEGAS